MSLGWLIALIALGAIIGPFLVYWRSQRGAKPASAEMLPLGARQRYWLARIPQLALLTPQQRAGYEMAVCRFVSGKRYIGCDGLTVTEEMRWLIAGLACLLILRPRAQVFPRLRAILVYPDAFIVNHAEPDEMGLVSNEPEERIGESWSGDRVILSWKDVELALAGDEVNVVAHEFAHQLDDAKAGAEGAPAGVDAARWAEVMKAEYERLRRHRRPSVLDPYGAESPAEFFAVATETYFQRGAELLKHHRALYELLRDYYGLETAELGRGPDSDPAL
jgi:hypothetical protein